MCQCIQFSQLIRDTKIKIIYKSEIIIIMYIQLKYVACINCITKQ